MCMVLNVCCEQELLELGDRIGYVSTGLREDQMARCLRKFKLSILETLSSNLPPEMEKKCSICQVSSPRFSLGRALHMFAPLSRKL